MPDPAMMWTLDKSKLIKLCELLGVDDKKVQRIVVDISCDELVKVYTQSFSDKANIEGMLEFLINEGS